MRNRRCLTLALLSAVIITAAPAAPRGGFGGGGFRGFPGRGFGGHTFGRGGFIQGHRGFVGGIRFGRGFSGHAGFRIGGFRAGFGGWYGRTAWSPGVWWPAYAPVYSYVPPYSYYSYAPPVAPMLTVITAPAFSATPATIVINEGNDGAPRPVRREETHSALTPPPPRGSSPIYLVATKDGQIWAARAYWVEGGSLHLVTMRDGRQSVAVDQIDRPFTEQLNRERRVEFRLP